MKLSKLHIKNFRKLNNVEINLADATFLVGANNSGKSTTLDAIEILTSEKKLDSLCRSKYISENGEELTMIRMILLSRGHFQMFPKILFNKRVSMHQDLLPLETVDDISYSFRYRVRLSPDNKSHREILMHTITLKSEYASCSTYQELIDKGIDPGYFDGRDLSKKLNAASKKELENVCPDLYDVNEVEEWFENPGVFQGMCYLNCHAF